MQSVPLKRHRSPAVDATQIGRDRLSQGEHHHRRGRTCPDVVAAIADVPFPLSLSRATELVDTYPYKRSPIIAIPIAIKWNSFS